MKQHEPISFGMTLLIIAAATAVFLGVRWLVRRVGRWARRRRKRQDAMEIVLGALLFTGISLFIILLTTL